MSLHQPPTPLRQHMLIHLKGQGSGLWSDNIDTTKVDEDRTKQF